MVTERERSRDIVDIGEHTAHRTRVRIYIIAYILYSICRHALSAYNNMTSPDTRGDIPDFTLSVYAALFRSKSLFTAKWTFAVQIHVFSNYEFTLFEHDPPRSSPQTAEYSYRTSRDENFRGKK